MKSINSALLAALLMGGIGSAAQASVLQNDRVEIYGTMRVSVDYIDVDAPDEGGGLGVSSNTSLFGLRGALPIDKDYTALYQIEQTIYTDETGGDLATRDTFLGVDTPMGKVMVGYMDTPYKYMGLVFSSYTTTAADPHAIFGAASSGGSPRLDLRGRNAIQYRGHLGDTLFMRLMYSTGYVEDDYGRDDNDSNMYSGSVRWKTPLGLQLGAAYVRYADWAGIGAKIDGYRLGARYSAGRWTLKALFESTDSDKVDAISRNAYGLGAEYGLTAKTRLGVQWVHADESDVGDDAADRYVLALIHSISKRLSVHAVVATTQNDEAASYRITDYGHGDKVKTVAGGDPSVFSIGATLRF